MKIVGIDLSAESKNTAVCVIDADKKIIAPPQANCEDNYLYEVIEQAQIIGIDAPFGWPDAFRDVVTANTLTEIQWRERSKLRLRCTDERLSKKLKEMQRENLPNPLSVSADKLAVAAWRAMALLYHFKANSDRSGTKKFGGRLFVEVYPAASLCWWNIARREGKVSYKDSAARELRRRMLAEIEQQMKQDIPEEYADTDHNLDALVAALTALAAFNGQTYRPQPSEMDRALSEGWIHLPSQTLEELKTF